MPEVRVIQPTVITDQKPRLRVATYCRVSSGSDEQLESYAAQVCRYTELISGNPDWELADIYADEAVTGTRDDKREDFQRMLRDCRRGKNDRILCKSISRFARNTQDGLRAIRELTSLGVSVMFEKENIDTGELKSEFMLGTYCSFAQRESESISGNMRWSYRHRMESGEFITCRAPFGYRLENRMLHVDETQAQVVRRIFREYLGGRGRREIAEGLSRDGIAKWDGTTDWPPSYVGGILHNERYKGDALLQKKYSTDILPYRKVRNHGERDQYYLHGSHPAIVSSAEFDAAQNVLQQRSGYETANKPQPRPFSRKVRCGVCGSNFRHKLSNGKAYWACRAHHSSKDTCPQKPIPEPALQAAFTRMTAKLQKNSRYILHPLLSGLLELADRQNQNNEKIGALHLEIAQLNEQNLVLARLRSKGYMDSVFFMEQTNELNRKITALRTDLRRLMGRDEDEQSIQDIRNLIDKIENAELSGSFDDRLFLDIVEKITVDSRTAVRFHLIGGLELTEEMQEVLR